jgi:hypothetical protein
MIAFAFSFVFALVFELAFALCFILSWSSERSFVGAKVCLRLEFHLLDALEVFVFLKNTLVFELRLVRRTVERFELGENAIGIVHRCLLRVSERRW